MLNEQLALWSGCWRKVKDDFGNPLWWNPSTGEFQGKPPDYEHFRDLIARDLLPRLTEEQRWKLTDEITQNFDRSPHVRPYSWLFLTLPPADLAAAIWEVVRG